jgi:proteasome lid subunit RPN8/RPN11
VIPPKVKIKRGAEAHFRKLARNSAKEVIAYLIGEVVSPSLVRVDHWKYPTAFKVQTKGEVQVTQPAENDIKAWADSKKLMIVGTIHSHPQWEAVLSYDDHKGHIEQCHRVSGVCAVRRNRRTRILYWVAESSLPCEVVYQ